MAKELTCPNCGKRFKQWRKKQYCTERCRKDAQNRRLGYVRRDAECPLPDSLKTQKISEQNQEAAEALRRYEPGLEWTACNEITQRLAKRGGNAVGWVIRLGGQRGWYGRVREGLFPNVGEEMSFGPTTLPRARNAVEAYLRREPFEKRDGERSWRGNCLHLL